MGFHRVIRPALLGCLVATTGCSALLQPLPASWSIPGWPRSNEESAPLDNPPLVERPSVDLPAPSGLRAHAGVYRRIPLRWDPMFYVGVGGYLVESAAAAEGPFTPLQPVWGRGRIAFVDGVETPPLDDGETRYYRLRAFAPDGRLSQASSSVVVSTTATPPASPQGVRAYSAQPREVPLSWRISDESTAAGYVIERSPGPEGPWETLASVNDRYQASFVDEGLGDLRVVYYRVFTMNAGGVRGEPSATVRAVTKAPPLPPLDLRLAGQGLGLNQLRWEPNVEPDIIEYQLLRLLSDEPPVLLATAPPDGTLTIADATVPAGAPRRYALVAVDRTGLVSRPSKPVDAPGIGYSLEGKATADGVKLRWNPRTDEGFVRTRIERENWLGVKILGTTGGGEFLDQEANPDGEYRYRVVLERADGSAAPPSATLVVDALEVAEVH